MGHCHWQGRGHDQKLCFLAWLCTPDATQQPGPLTLAFMSLWPPASSPCLQGSSIEWGSSIRSGESDGPGVIAAEGTVGGVFLQMFVCIFSGLDTGYLGQGKCQMFYVHIYSGCGLVAWLVRWPGQWIGSHLLRRLPDLYPGYTLHTHSYVGLGLAQQWGTPR